MVPCWSSSRIPWAAACAVIPEPTITYRFAAMTTSEVAYYRARIRGRTAAEVSRVQYTPDARCPRRAAPRRGCARAGSVRDPGLRRRDGAAADRGPGSARQRLRPRFADLHLGRAADEPRRASDVRAAPRGHGLPRGRRVSAIGAAPRRHVRLRRDEAAHERPPARSALRVAPGRAQRGAFLDSRCVRGIALGRRAPAHPRGERGPPRAVAEPD